MEEFIKLVLNLVLDKAGPEWLLIFMFLWRDIARERESRRSRDADFKTKYAIANALRQLAAKIKSP